MTAQHPRSQRRRPRIPHEDTGLRSVAFPHKRDTATSLFRGWQAHAASDHENDGHPDPLRMWRDHGPTCPEDWYVVRCRVTGSGKQQLTLLVEMNPPAPGGTTFHHKLMMRTVWWTPSREHAGEVARQIAHYERIVYRSYDLCLMPLYRPPVSPLLARGMMLDLWGTSRTAVALGHHTWDSLSVDIQVYQRIASGPHPRLISTTTVPFLTRPWAR